MGRQPCRRCGQVDAEYCCESGSQTMLHDSWECFAILTARIASLGRDLAEARAKIDERNLTLLGEVNKKLDAEHSLRDEREAHAATQAELERLKGIDCAYAFKADAADILSRDADGLAKALAASQADHLRTVELGEAMAAGLEEADVYDRGAVIDLLRAWRAANPKKEVKS
jgi:hypothetical protein